MASATGDPAMRFMVLIIGLLGAAGPASAGEQLSGHDDSGAATGQLVYEARFGGDRPSFTPSFQFRFGSEQQLRSDERAPFVAEYRPGTDSILVNGLDLSPMLVNRQVEEGGIAGALGGWIPLLIVLTAATFIAVDGNDLTAEDLFGTGATGG